jgi:hypothetical protein
LSGTKDQYSGRFENPDALFPGVKATLWPNGEQSIWFTSPEGREGMSITVSHGPYGLALTVKRIAFTPPLAITGNIADTGLTRYVGSDLEEVTITQYHSDEQAQQFKQWHIKSADGLVR